MDERIRVEIQDGVADVRLLRGDKMNALDSAMFDALIATGERLKTEPGLRAVVLSGEGRAFCAGLDMSNFEVMADGASPISNLLTDERSPGGANRAQHAVMVWREIPVPVIAAIHGVAFGGGCQLALAADLRFIAADARMSLLEIKWGLVPDMGGMVLIRGLVRADVARDLIYTGRIAVGAEAVEVGLASRVCADPRAEALAYARDIASRSPDAIRAGKRLLEMLAEADAREILLEESREQTALLGTPNQMEAIMANLQKRDPKFSDS